MGLLRGIFNRMGYSHIRMLTKDGAKLVISTLMAMRDRSEEDVSIDTALDLLIEEGGYKYIKERNIQDPKIKFSEFVKFYVVRNLGREIDFFADDNKILNEEIEKYWSNIEDSNIL
jgi:hypothetical protein